MCISPIWHQWNTRLSRWIIALFILCLAWLGWLAPAQADLTINSEEQVLQVIRDHPEVIVESLQEYQRQQQEQQEKARQALFEAIKRNPSQVINDSPSTGAVQSKIVLLEFSDFQCPYCARANTILKQFMSSHQDEVTLVYKHFPLTTIHPEAMAAAKASWAALQQGKFWQYHDALFTQQDQLGEELYLSTARNLNLDLARFNKDRNSSVADAAVQKDIEMAGTLGIGSTPFFVMNGETFAGAVPLANLEKGLQQRQRQ